MKFTFVDYLIIGVVAFLFVFTANKGLTMIGLEKFKA